MSFKYVLNGFALFLLVLCSACGGRIPEAYQGKFVDNAKGAVLELESSSATLNLPGGRTLSQSIEDLEPEVEWSKIVNGQPGIYTRESGRKLKIYWISPDASTRGVSPDRNYVWYDQVEILYFTADIKQKHPVDQIEVVHSTSGKMELDVLNKRWVLGWQPQPIRYMMKRQE